MILDLFMKLQILTIEGLMNGTAPRFPDLTPGCLTLKRAAVEDMGQSRINYCEGIIESEHSKN
jgi:hypothetical protein